MIEPGLPKEECRACGKRATQDHVNTPDHHRRLALLIERECLVDSFWSSQS